MTIDRRLIAGAMGLAIALAACGGATPNPAGTASATAAPTTTPVDETDAAPTETAVPSEGGIGLPTGTNELAAILPEDASGISYQRAGFNGDQLGIYGAAAGLDSDQLTPV